MKLPKRDVPSFSIKLPVSNREITYRPYTIKEEKILDMAQVSDSDNDKFKAIKQIIENCSDITTDKLHPADLQFLFLKIYAVSDTPNINVTYNIAAEDCGSTEDDKYAACPKVLTTSFSIDRDVSIVNTDALDKNSIKAKGDGRIIDLVDNIKLQIDFKTVDDTNTEKLDFIKIVYDMLISVIFPDADDPENIIVLEKKDMPYKEFSEFLESFQPKDLQNLKDFFTDTARCEANIKAKCPKCKKTFETKQTGLLSFLI